MLAKKTTLRALFIDTLSDSPHRGTASVEALIEALAARYDLDEQRCLGAGRTRECIRSALQQLAERVAPGDAVLVHYAGHGGVCNIIDAGEALPAAWYRRPWPFMCPGGWFPRHTGLDEAYFADELVEFLHDAIASKTNDLTVILDCCHAGAMLVPGLLPSVAVPVPIRELAARGFCVDGDHLDELVCIQATGDESKAYYDGQAGPAMSRALASAFELFGPNNRPPAVPWASLMNHVRREVMRAHAQVPRVIGAAGRVPFGSRSIDITTRMDCVVDVDRARVQCGSLHGLALGDFVDVVDHVECCVRSARISAPLDYCAAGLVFVDGTPSPGSYDAYLIESNNREPVEITDNSGGESARLPELVDLITGLAQVRCAGPGARSRFAIHVEPQGYRLRGPMHESVHRSRRELICALLGAVRAAWFCDFAERFADTDRAPMRLCRLDPHTKVRHTLVDGDHLASQRLLIAVERSVEPSRDDERYFKYRVALLELRPEGDLREVVPPTELAPGADSKLLASWEPLTGRLYMLATVDFPNTAPLLGPRPDDEPSDLHRATSPEQRSIEPRFCHVQSLELRMPNSPPTNCPQNALHPEPRSDHPSCAELLYRARSLRAALDEWLDERSFTRAARLSEAQAQALMATFDEDRRALDMLEAKLDAAGPDERRRLSDELEHAMCELERSRALVLRVVAQRLDLAHLGGLQVADLCALDGFAAALGRDLGRRSKTTPPIVMLDPTTGPAISAPNAPVMLPSVVDPRRRSLAVPLVYVPPGYLRAPWLLTTLQHEVGHALDWLLGLADTLWPVVRAEASQQHLGRWRDWLAEVVADLCGVVLGGQGFAFTLATLISADAGSVAREYPPPALRAHIVRVALRELGGELDTQCDSSLARVPVRESLTVSDFTEAERLTLTLLHAPLSVANGCLANMVDFPDEARRSFELAELLASDAALDVELRGYGAHQRLIPSAAQLAIGRPDAPDFAAIARRALEAASTMQRPEWILGPDHLEFLDVDVESLRPTILTRSAGGPRKAPPVELLAASTEMAFVGVTHPGLLAALQHAHELRRAPWRRIEVFFIQPDLLAWFADSEVGVDELEQQRRANPLELAEFLGDARVADEFMIYEYARPFLFAAYYDWLWPEGRIHTSTHLWGAVVSHTPGLDVCRGDPPTPRYEALVAGLSSLRQLPDTRALMPVS